MFFVIFGLFPKGFFIFLYKEVSEKIAALKQFLLFILVFVSVAFGLKT